MRIDNMATSTATKTALKKLKANNGNTRGLSQRDKDLIKVHFGGDTKRKASSPSDKGSISITKAAAARVKARKAKDKKAKSKQAKKTSGQRKKVKHK